jgi:hypothetical protein
MMDGCLPCKCGSSRLIPSVYMGNPTMIAIRCIDCDNEGEKYENIKKATLIWNQRR